MWRNIKGIGLKKFLILSLLMVFCRDVKAQFFYGTTGLLHLPTADMQRDKTFLAGASFLHNEATPHQWWYNTYNYYVNVTFFPWLEVSYTCTLNKAVNRDYYGNPVTYWVPRTYGKFVNQDRMFSVRLRLWKEGWWKSWTPQVVLGGNDVLTESWKGGAMSVGHSNSYTSNGYWNRIYIAATKHFEVKRWVDLGLHATYIYNRREDFRYNGIGVGVNAQLALSEGTFWQTALNGLNLMAEYDSRTLNIGMGYRLWKDHINLVGELNRCKYPSVGIYFKVHLK